jgi:hypothetical protein
VPAGQKQLLEEFGDLASMKYRWNLEGLDPSDERYHDNVCSDLTDAQVLAKIVQELKKKAVTDLAAELASQGTSVARSEYHPKHEHECYIISDFVSWHRNFLIWRLGSHLNSLRGLNSHCKSSTVCCLTQALNRKKLPKKLEKSSNSIKMRPTARESVRAVATQ